MIIDAHMHLMEHLAPFCAKGEGRPVGNGVVRFATGEEVQMIPVGMGDCSYTAESCIQLMDENGIDMSVLLQRGFYGFQNEYVAEVASKYPGRFYPVAGLDPYCQNKEKILDNFIEHLGIKALKFEMSQFCGIVSYHPDFKIDGPEMQGVFERADHERMAVAFDIGGPGQTSYQIAEWRSVIEKYHNIHFIACHILVPKQLEQPGWAEELKSIAAGNTWFDFAAIPYNNMQEYPYPTAAKLVEQAAEIVGVDRLMWGSDAPFVLSYATYAQLRDYIRESGVFGDADLRKLYGENAVQAYRIR